MKNYRLYLIVLSALLIFPLIVGVACNLGTTPVTPTPIIPPTSSQKPVIEIKSPLNNADTVVNKAITVEISSSHPEGVTRVELRANGLQVDSKVSQNSLGDPQFSAFLTYTPTSTGALTLTAIAYRGVTASDPATVTINVVAGQAQVTPTEAIAVPTIDTDPTCRARVDVSGLNFRAGPGVNYPVLKTFGLGTQIRLTGRLGDNTWWQGAFGNQVGWLNSGFITLLGFCSNIPTANPPPSPAPTQAPTNTPGPTQPNPTAVLPDLVVVNLVNVSGSVQIMLSQAGTATASFQITVQNVGAVNSGQFSVALTLPNSTLQAVGTVQTLAPGQQAILTANVAFNAPGSVRLIAIVDSGNQITEKDETNNLRTLDLVVIKPTPLPGPTSTPVTPTATLAATSTSTMTATATLAATATPTTTSTVTSTMTVTTTVTATLTATSTSTPTATP